MKLVIIFLVLSVQSIFAFQEWEDFKAKYQKGYKNVAEEIYRKQVFLKNLQMIDEHNQKYEQGLTTFKLGVNKLADTTKEERSFASQAPKYIPPVAEAPSKSTFVPSDDVPDSIDWRDYGVITPIADQLFCNACWAFAVVGTVEAHMGIYRGVNVSLSQQNLEDCVDPKFTCEQPMDRQILEKTYQYIVDNNGIDTYDSYPFLATSVTPCHYSVSDKGASIKSYANITEGDEEELKRVVGTIGPVTVAITTQLDWDLYVSGVYYKADCMDTTEIFNHAVIVVGYGNEDGQDYWLVKNSWGSWFGQQGYIKMARNRDNNCGIASIARYPIM